MEGADEDPLRSKEAIQALEDFLQQVTNLTVGFSNKLQAYCNNCPEAEKEENANLERDDDDSVEKIPCERCVVQRIISGLLSVAQNLEENIHL